MCICWFILHNVTANVGFVDRVFIRYECYKYFISWNGYQQMFFWSKECHIRKQTFHFHLMLMLNAVLFLPGCDTSANWYSFDTLQTLREFQAVSLSSRTWNESCAQCWYCHYSLAPWVSQLCLVVKVSATGFNPLQHVGLGRERELAIVQWCS